MHVSIARSSYLSPFTLLAFALCIALAACGGDISLETMGSTGQAVTGTIILSGELTEPTGQPVDGVRVSLNGSRQATATTDFMGRYSFTVPAGGGYSLSASGVCASWTPGVVNLNNVTTNRVVNFAGSGGQCVIAPQQGATSGSLTISGHVTSAGHPVAGARVVLNGSAQGSRISDQTGAYSFSVNPGSFSLGISGACSSFSPSVVNLNNVTASQVRNFVGAGNCPPAPLTFCPALDSLFIGQDGGPACATITTTSCPDRVNSWDVAIVSDYAFALSADCRFGQWSTTFPLDALVDYLNDLVAFTLEVFGCPFQGLQAGPLTDRLVPAFFSSHLFSTAELQALTDDYVAGFQQAFADFGLPPPTAAQVAALRAQFTYLESKVPNSAPGSSFGFSTCP